MDIREAFAVDAQSYRSLLGLTAGHDSQAHEISWDLPVESPLGTSWPNPGRTNTLQRLMFRVVDGRVS